MTKLFRRIELSGVRGARLRPVAGADDMRLFWPFISKLPSSICRILVIWPILARTGGAWDGNETTRDFPSTHAQCSVVSQETLFAPLADELWLETVRNNTQGQKETLHVSNSSVSRSQIEGLPQSPWLRALMLDGGTVDDNGLAAIAKACPRLEHLRLRLSPVTEKGAQHLAKLTELRILNLPQSRLSDQAIAQLKPLKRLEQVRLGGSQLTDQAIVDLIEMPNLRWLHLIGPMLTDHALELLAKAPRLNSLYLDDCPLSEEAFDRLRRAKPLLHIHLDQDHVDRVLSKSDNITLKPPTN